MFEASSGSRPDPRAEWERDAQIRRQVEEELRTEGGELYFRDFERYRFESERRALRKKADLGLAPRAYSHKVPFIHAHSLVYAVDSFGKFLVNYVITTQPLRQYARRAMSLIRGFLWFGRFETPRCI